MLYATKFESGSFTPGLLSDHISFLSQARTGIIFIRRKYIILYFVRVKPHTFRIAQTSAKTCILRCFCQRWLKDNNNNNHVVLPKKIEKIKDRRYTVHVYSYLNSHVKAIDTRNPKIIGNTWTTAKKLIALTNDSLKRENDKDQNRQLKIWLYILLFP